MASGEALKEVSEEPIEFLEPWRCANCSQLMYNITPDGYAAPGAPVGLNVTIKNKKLRVCLLCAKMYVAVGENEYLNDLHREWVKEQEHKQKLMSGHNYLDRKE